MTTLRWLAAFVIVLIAPTPGSAQSLPANRLTIIHAEARGAREARDLAMLRSGVRSKDGETVRAAVRALGRLRRPAVVSDIAPALKSALPEVRAEAASAVGQAFTPPAAATAGSVDAAFTLLMNAAQIEEEASVRSAILDAVGRLPYGDTRQIERAETLLLGFAESGMVMDRLGVAKGFEALVRLQASRWVPGSGVLVALRRLLGVVEPSSTSAGSSSADAGRPAEASHDARVRRLALEALTSARAIDEPILHRAAADRDAQVRRLGILAALATPGPAGEGVDRVLHAGLSDDAPMVRVEAIRGLAQRARGDAASCQAALDATHDSEPQVAAAGFRALRDCGPLPEVVAYLEQTVNGRPETQGARGWVPAVHAFDALAAAAPELARGLLESFASSAIPQLRLQAVSVAALFNDRDRLAALAADDSLVVRAAARGALGSDAALPDRAGASTTPPPEIDAADLRRLASPRARVTVRDVGSFDLVLVATEAPATVLRFARLAETGYFNGTSLADAPSALVNLHMPEAGRPLEPGEALRTLHQESGSWPHVRGTVGLSLDGAATGGAQLFINLVDNPRFDHHLAVFAQVLSGIEIVDRLLPGDVVDSIEILP